ncbi:MAG: pitrilysin family protein [Thermoanaerobaculia bacterium]
MLVHALRDGTAVWLDPMRDVRSVALGIYVASGSASEGPDLLGSTHFLEHLLFKRTRRRTGPAIARMTDRLGGECDAYTSKESVAFHARTTSERLEECIDLLFDLTEAPAFTADDVEVERGVILEEMAEANDVPEDNLHDTFLRSLWPQHPLGAPVLGTKESVEQLTRTRLVQRFRDIFRPERMVIVAVGAFDPVKIMGMLEKASRDRRSRPVPLTGGGSLQKRERAPRAAPCAFHVARPELSQVHLLIGAPTIPYGHPMQAAAHLSVVALGGGVSSRLWRDVREKRGLAYHVGTGLTLHRDAGLSLIEAATAPKNLTRLVKTAGRAVRHFVADGLSAAELERAKNQTRAEVALALESTSARREHAARAWLYRGRPHEPDEILSELARVTKADVAHANRLLFGSLGPVGIGIAGPPLDGPSIQELASELAA